VEFENERHEVPNFLQHHGITLHMWQNWFDTIHDLWEKRVLQSIDEMLPGREIIVSIISSFLASLLSMTSNLEPPFDILPIIFLPFIPLFSLFFLSVFYVSHQYFIEASWVHFASELRENECIKHGLIVESIQYELYDDYGDQIIKQTLTVGL
jgi:hypothetical protein